MRRSALALVSALGLFASSVGASAQELRFNLDLIGSEDTKDGKCSLVFLARNKLGIDIRNALFEVTILDVSEQVKGTINLRLPAIASGKQRAVKYEFQVPCKQIASLLPGYFKECMGDKDSLDLCNAGLRMSSKIKIAFTDEAT